MHKIIKKSKKLSLSYLIFNKQTITHILYISLHIKIMLISFRVISSIQRFSNIVQKGRLGFCIRQQIICNQQILACKTPAQAQKIFHQKHKLMDATNLLTILKKTTQQKHLQSERLQGDYLIKSILLQIQLCWDQLMFKYDFNILTQLLLLLSRQKAFDLNKKIMELDLLQFFYRVSQKQKGLLLSLIIQLNLQKQFNQKYAGSKAQILCNTQFIKKNHIEPKLLLGQHIINLLIYQCPFIRQVRYSISLWRHIVKKNLDTKLFNNYMIRILVENFEAMKKNGDQLKTRYYLNLLKVIKAVNDDIQGIDVKQVLKSYPKSLQDLKSIQICNLYSIAAHFPQFKYFIQQQLKLLKQNQIKEDKSNQTESHHISQQKNPTILLYMMQNKAIKQLKNMNMADLDKMAYYVFVLSQFYFHTPQFFKEIQENFIKIITKQDQQPDYQLVKSYFNSMTKIYKAKGTNFPQFENVYNKIIQFTIYRNLDLVETEQLINLLLFLVNYQKMYPKKTDFLKQYENQFTLKMLSTLRNKNRMVNSKDIISIMSCFLKLQIFNEGICEFIKQKIQALQMVQRDQHILKRIMSIKTNQIKLSCSMTAQICKCKSNEKQKLHLML